MQHFAGITYGDLQTGTDWHERNRIDQELRELTAAGLIAEIPPHHTETKEL